MGLGTTGGRNINRKLTISFLLPAVFMLLLAACGEPERTSFTVGNPDGSRSPNLRLDKKDYLPMMRDIFCHLLVWSYSLGDCSNEVIYIHSPHYPFKTPTSAHVTTWEFPDSGYDWLLSDLKDLRAVSGEYQLQHVNLERQIEAWVTEAKVVVNDLTAARVRHFNMFFNPKTPITCTMILPPPPDHGWLGEDYPEIFKLPVVRQAVRSCEKFLDYQNENLQNILEYFEHRVLGREFDKEFHP